MRKMLKRIKIIVGCLYSSEIVVILHAIILFLLSILLGLVIFCGIVYLGFMIQLYLKNSFLVDIISIGFVLIMFTGVFALFQYEKTKYYIDYLFSFDWLIARGEIHKRLLRKNKYKEYVKKRAKSNSNFNSPLKSNTKTDLKQIGQTGIHKNHEISMDEIRFEPLSNYDVFDLDKNQEYHENKTNISGKAVKVNWLKLNALKQEIGDIGEEIVLAYEKNKWKQLGHSELVSHIKHVSKTIGDGLGYDIVSFNENFEEVKIEVKSTIKGLYENLYFSSNELAVMNKYRGKYFLYRVFDLNLDTKSGKIAMYYGKEEIIESFNFRINSVKAKLKK